MTPREYSMLSRSFSQREWVKCAIGMPRTSFSSARVTRFSACGSSSLSTPIVLQWL